MATLHCRHCDHAIDSDARSAQCRECRALFPFACAVCRRNLRGPFPVVDDERHLTLDEPLLPLCQDHFLRQCPDCERWFQSDENPGYFRCLHCAQQTRVTATHPEWSDDWSDASDDNQSQNETEAAELPRGVPLAVGARASLPANTLALATAGCAVLALLGWLLFGH